MTNLLMLAASKLHTDKSRQYAKQYNLHSKPVIQFETKDNGKVWGFPVFLIIWFSAQKVRKYEN